MTGIHVVIQAARLCWRLLLLTRKHDVETGGLLVGKEQLHQRDATRTPGNNEMGIIRKRFLATKVAFFMVWAQDKSKCYRI